MESKIVELWKKGLLHNSRGPAVKTHRLGRLYEENWNNGMLHCKTGPAVIHHGINQEFYIENCKKNTERLGETIKLPYLNDEDFSKVKYLNTRQRKWEKFPGSRGQNIPIYLNKLFDGLNPFSRFGDFGATAKFIVDYLPKEHLENDKTQNFYYEQNTNNKNSLLGKLLKSLDEVKYSISYDDNVSADVHNSPTLVDTLGSYNLENKLIKLYIKKIFFRAQDIDTKFSNFSGSTAMTLTYMVFLHELGHAIHHAVRGGSIKDADMITDIEKCEIIAQHFMMTCIEKFGVRAVCIESELANSQPSVYNEWSNVGIPTTFEGFKKLLRSDREYAILIKQQAVKDNISKNDKSGWDL